MTDLTCTPSKNKEPSGERQLFPEHHVAVATYWNTETVLVIILTNSKLNSHACSSLSVLKRQNTRSKTKIPFFKEVL